jgi:hypothetical protein
MLIEEAQAEVRRVYRGGLVGQAVSGILWMTSAGFATWRGSKSAMVILVVGGFAIYPVTALTLRLSGRPAALGPANPFRFLAIQAAFVLPLSMPLVAPVVAYRPGWFYPAMMILLGAHYLPFATLYGMRSFLALAAILVSSGVGIALHAPEHFSLGGWFTGIVLCAFAAVGHAESRRLRPA